MGKRSKWIVHSQLPLNSCLDSPTDTFQAQPSLSMSFDFVVNKKLFKEMEASLMSIVEDHVSAITIE